MAQQAALDSRAPAAVPDVPGRLGRTFSVERLIIGAVVIVAVLLVAYPVLFLIQASLNGGRPDARPIVAYGLSNYLNIFNRVDWLLNTLYVSSFGTVLAVFFGLVLAW